MAEVFLWKPIKPGKINNRALIHEVEKELERQAAKVVAEFEKTTATWDHSVDFDHQVSVANGTIRVWTDDEIYGYVNDGTRPHRIEARNADVLVFREGYVAKTKPRKIGSSGGGPYGPLVFRPSVQHPGTEARNFDEVIREKSNAAFQFGVSKALLIGTVKAGLGRFR